MAPTVLLTGSSGLIGTRVRQVLLPSGLRLLSLREIAPTADLLRQGTPLGIIDAINPDVLLHFAWVASGTPGYREHLENDSWVEATLELSRACESKGVWFIGTGSVVEVENQESDRYTKAKAETWRCLQESIERNDITWLRPHYVFDPFLGRPRLVGDVLEAGARRKPPSIMTPEARHDFIHALDVASAVGAILQHELRGLVEISSGTEHTVAALAASLGAEGYRRCPGNHERGASSSAPSRLHSVGWEPTWTERFFHG